MSTSYYGRRKADGSTQKVMLNLGEGLNEFLPPMSIRDGQLAACKNFYSTDGISLTSTPYHVDYTADARDLGELVFYGADIGAIPSLFSSGAEATYLDFGTTVDISSLEFGTMPTVDGILYVSQSGSYAVYGSAAQKGILVYEIGGLELV